MPEPRELVPLIELNWAMTPEYREAVVRRALEYSKTKKGKLGLLNKALKHILQIRGYMHPTSAPLVMLAPAVTDAFQQANEVVAAVLALWQEANANLLEAMANFLKIEGVELNPINSHAQHFAGLHPVLEMDRHQKAFRRKFSDFDKDDVFLMYLCQRGTFFEPLGPDDEEENMSQSEETQARYIWTDWLEYLRQLPPEAPQWATMDKFVAEIQNLVEQKNQERQGAIRLQAALEELCKKCAEQLQFFDFNECTTWQVSKFLPAQIGQTTETIITLQNLLVEYKGLEQQRPTNFRERQARNQKFDELGKQVIEVYQELQRLFATPQAEFQESENIEQTTTSHEVKVPEETHSTNKEADIVVVNSDYDMSPDNAFPEREILIDEQLNNEEFITKDSLIHSSNSSEKDISAVSLHVEEPKLHDDVSTLLKEDYQLDSRETVVAAESLNSEAKKFIPAVTNETSELEPCLILSETPHNLLTHIQQILPRWLGSWPDLPKAYLLTTWINDQTHLSAEGYPSPELCEIAYYALQPILETDKKNIVNSIESPDLNHLWACMQHPADELKAAAWYLAAALVSLRGENSVGDLLEFRYDWTNNLEFAPWYRMAEILHIYWNQTSETVYEVKRRLQYKYKLTNLREEREQTRKLSQDTLVSLQKPGKSQHLRNIIVRQKLNWLQEALKRDIPGEDVSEWARKFQPEHELDRWTEEILGYRVKLNEPEPRQIIRHLHTLHSQVSRWIKLNSDLQDDQHLQTVNDAFQVLTQVITEEGEGWRRNWLSLGAQWPVLSGWSSLLLERLEEVISPNSH